MTYPFDKKKVVHWVVKSIRHSIIIEFDESEGFSKAQKALLKNHNLLLD